MKKILALAAVIFCLGMSAVALGAEPQVTAEAAIVIDAQSGQVICQRDAFSARPPASLTKVMTTILAIELGDMDKVCTVSAVAAATEPSRVGLQAGERLKLEQLLYGALLRSGNDACVAIGENMAYDCAQYVEMMNLKAALLGCYSTHFANTNGLPQDEHYSSCYDMALIARYALQNEVFRQIVATKQYTMSWENGRTKALTNTNHLLFDYDGAIGVKTGATKAAGQCLIAAATRDERTYIAVVLNSRERFGDCTKLLDYAFSLEDINR